jgi:hypothetical protein
VIKSFDLSIISTINEIKIYFKRFSIILKITKLDKESFKSGSKISEIREHDIN